MKPLTPKAQGTLAAYELQQVGKSPTTMTLYRSVIAGLLAEADDAPLTAQVVILHLNDIAGRNAPSSVATKAVILRAFLKWATVSGLCDDGVSECCKVHAPQSKTPRTATPDEITALYAAVTKPRFRLALLLATNLGLRESEIRGLRWIDVDLDGLTIAVFGKGSKWRTLPLTNETLLEELRASKGEPMQYLVSSGAGTMLARGALGHSLKRLCAKAGIRELNVHSLRHSFASSAHKGGVSARGVQAMLGHANLTTTAGYLKSLSGVDSLREEMTTYQNAAAAAASAP
ncbi:MAG: tyrosine-type recombinase/integrase [Armatimonadota bacterium]